MFVPNDQLMGVRKVPQKQIEYHCQRKERNSSAAWVKTLLENYADADNYELLRVEEAVREDDVFGLSQVIQAWFEQPRLEEEVRRAIEEDNIDDWGLVHEEGTSCRLKNKNQEEVSTIDWEDLVEQRRCGLQAHVDDIEDVLVGCCCETWHNKHVEEEVNEDKP